MHRCHFARCAGHDELGEAILHGQLAILTSLAVLRRDLGLTTTGMEHLMGIAQDILDAENAEAAAVTALGGAVTTAVGQLQAANAQIADLIANGSLSDDDKAALQNALDSAHSSTTALAGSLAEVNAALNPAPPADSGGEGAGGADQPPTDGPGDGDTTPPADGDVPPADGETPPADSDTPPASDGSSDAGDAGTDGAA